jgi:hypothetical protein
MAVVIALALVSVMLAATTWQILTHRSTLERRLNQAQASWLARAGVERAVARLLADTNGYAGEVVELIPRSKVQITVEPQKGQPGTFHVISEVHFPTDAPHPVVRSATRRFRLIAEDNRTRVTVVAPEGTDLEKVP